jgi:hypothetical protein
MAKYPNPRFPSLWHRVHENLSPGSLVIMDKLTGAGMKMGFEGVNAAVSREVRYGVFSIMYDVNTGTQDAAFLKINDGTLEDWLRAKGIPFGE